MLQVERFPPSFIHHAIFSMVFLGLELIEVRLEEPDWSQTCTEHRDVIASWKQDVASVAVHWGGQLCVATLQETQEGLPHDVSFQQTRGLPPIVIQKNDLSLVRTQPAESGCCWRVKCVLEHEPQRFEQERFGTVAFTYYNNVSVLVSAFF